MLPAHYNLNNVVPLRGGDTRSVRFRSDIMSRVVELVEDCDRFVSTFRLQPAGLEPALDLGQGNSREPDAAGFMAKLRACHRRAPLYVVESTGQRVWNTVSEDEHLLVAPSCRLRTLGLCLVGFTDGRPPDLRVFVGRRDTPSGPVWVLTSGNTEPATIEPSSSLAALHPILGSLLPAMTYDRQWLWTSRMADFIEAKDSRETSVNPKWRLA